MRETGARLIVVAMSTSTHVHAAKHANRLGRPHLGARVSRADLRPLPVGRRAGRDASRSERSCSIRRAGRTRRDRQRHRSEPAALPRRPRRAGPGRTRPAMRCAAGAACPALGASSRDRRRAGGAAAVRRRVGRHGRVDLRVVHGRRSRPWRCGDRAGAAARRSVALHRARPLRLAGARLLAGPSGRTRGVASPEAVAATARPSS